MDDQRLAWLAEQAVALDTASYRALLTRQIPDPDRSVAEFAARVRPAAVRAMRMHLDRVAQILTAVEDLPAEEAFGWLVVAIGSPVPYGEEVRRLGVAGVREWLPVGPLGSLAWAAGLTVEEAQARRAVGTLEAEGLRMLAVLRDYRLAEFEVG